MPKDFTRDELDELVVLASDIRMAMDIEERVQAGEVELIGFADGERVMLPVSPEVVSRLAAKRQALQAVLEQRISMKAVE